jgi:hypothetical protein
VIVFVSSHRLLLEGVEASPNPTWKPAAFEDLKAKTAICSTSATIASAMAPRKRERSETVIASSVTATRLFNIRA